MMILQQSFLFSSILKIHIQDPINGNSTLHTVILIPNKNSTAVIATIPVIHIRRKQLFDKYIYRANLYMIVSSIISFGYYNK